MKKAAASKLLDEAIQVLEWLEVAEGRLSKEGLLERHRDNGALKAIIKMAIGTDRYFVRPSVNVVCVSALTPFDSWRVFKRLTVELKNRELTGNAARTKVQQFLVSCRPKMMKWYCRILNHDLRIGVDKLTVQKAWGDTFLLGDSAVNIKWQYKGCALALKYADVYAKRVPSFPLALESKYDGERANLICFPRDNEIFVLTRKARRRERIEQVKPFRDQILAFCQALNGDNQRPLFLDGEFLARKWNDTSSIVQRTTNFNEEKFLGEVRVVLWDWSPLDQYLAGRFDMKWLRRKSALLHAAGKARPVEHLVPFAPNVWVAGHTIVYDAEQLKAEYTKRTDAGLEGVMLKNMNAPHLFKRTKDLVKLKPEDTCSGRIIGVHPGADQNGAIKFALRDKIDKLLRSFGEVEKTELYLHCKPTQRQQSETLIAEIKRVANGDGERRISTHLNGTVSYRHGQRLGYFVVELDDGVQIHVGGGFKTKAGNDERALYWERRDELLGMVLDFKQDSRPTADTTANFPRFVRLREDLS